MAAEEIWLAVWPEGEERPLLSTLADFLTVNDEDAELQQKVQRLQPGQSLGGGGGAAPTWVVTRLQRPDRLSWAIEPQSLPPFYPVGFPPAVLRALDKAGIADMDRLCAFTEEELTKHIGEKNADVVKEQLSAVGRNLRQVGGAS